MFMSYDMEFEGSMEVGSSLNKFRLESATHFHVDGIEHLQFTDSTP